MSPNRKRSSSRKRGRTAAWRRRRRLVLAGLVAVVALAVGAGGGFDNLREMLPESIPTALPDPSGSAGAPAGPGASGDVDVDGAREQLDQLEVGEWAAMSGYSRDRFPHWNTVDGCDVRQTVLERDGEDVKMDDECRAVSGT